MTPYRTSHYIDPLLQMARYILASMTSLHVVFAVLFTGLFAVQILQAFDVAQPVIDAVFIPCGIYFVWALAIGMIDMHIDRGELL